MSEGDAKLTGVNLAQHWKKQDFSAVVMHLDSAP